MAYNALARHEDDDAGSDISSPSPVHGFRLVQDGDEGTASKTLFTEQHELHTDESPYTTVANKVQSLVSRSTAQPDYNMLEDDDYSLPNPALTPSPARSLVASKHAHGSVGISQQQKQQQQQQQEKTAHDSISNPSPSRQRSNPSPSNRKVPPLVVPQPRRSASIRSIQLSPTTDLQSMQASFITNVEHLERTAEQLSMTSSIDDAIRQLHQEQKRADSQPSSIVSSPIVPISRQFSNPQSILDINNAARSGGYSPGGFNMASPRHSLSTTNRGRSSSKSSRFSSRPEPELEGRPLDAFVSPSHQASSPVMSRSTSIAEQDEGPATLTRQFTNPRPQPLEPHHEEGVDAGAPPTPRSVTTFDHQQMFEDFDGEHYAPSFVSRHNSIVSNQRVSSDGNRFPTADPPANARPLSDLRSLSNPINNRASLARPLSYADPSTGQNMVYYPAPVPSVLNLPTKLSTRPSSTIMDKRRTQILNSMLPDVFEDENGDEVIDDDDTPLAGKRTSMAANQALATPDAVPPQLRASVFFEQQNPTQAVAVKDASAVATLDSILDASAFAPVNAFTDHTYGIRLGAEVYGANGKRASTTMNTDKRKTLTKRMSSSTMLQTRRSGSGLLVPEEEEHQAKRRSGMSGMFGMKKFSNKSDMGDDELDGFEAHVNRPAPISRNGDEEEEEETDSEQEGQFDDEAYHGPPTTLLAELHLRKRQQKQRTRPAGLVRPDGTSTTFMEREAVAKIETRNRAKKRVNLAWEDPNRVAQDEQESDDEDVPLGILYQTKTRENDPTRPLGLLERRVMEDNEPLSRRRDRLLGRPVANRGPTAIVQFPPNDRAPSPLGAVDMTLSVADDPVLIHHGRSISGDFVAEMMSEIGIDAVDSSKKDVKGKGREMDAPVPVADEEEETLGQRRKRLQAEKEARAKEFGPQAESQEARPALKKGHSMADILQAVPEKNGGIRSHSYGNNKPLGGLLGMHEQQQQAKRMSNMTGMEMRPLAQRAQTTQQPYRTQHAQQQQPFLPQNYGTPGVDLGSYNMQQMMMPSAYTQPGFGTMSSPTMPGYGNGMTMGGGGGGGLYGYNNPMAASMLQLQMQMDQLSNVIAERQQVMGQGQVDMVERWRQSVLQ